MRMKRAMLAVAVLLSVLTLWRSPVGASEAVDVSVIEVGWWSSRPGALAQPDGGFEVAASPTGESQSIAALRLSIAATSVDSLQIRLDEARSAGTQFGALKLCATAAVWSAANPGDMAIAPAPDCTISAGLTRTTDGVWLGDAGALVRNGGVVSLVVVANYAPPAPIGPGLLVTISGGDLTATGSASATPTTSDPTPTTGSDPFGFSPSDDSFAPIGGGSFGISTGIIEPDFGTASPESPVTEAPRESVDDFALDPVPIDSEPPPPWIRLILLAPLSAGFGVGSVRLRRVLDERGVFVG